MLCCPNCFKELRKQEKCYKCDNNHSFDIAKQGYVNLAFRNSQTSGDDKEMIDARSNFLMSHHYDFLLNEINKILKEYSVNNLVDIASGQGYYTKSFQAKNKIGVDLSKSGIKYASKNDLSTTYVLASIFNLPIMDEKVEAITLIFAPIPKEEIVRVLKERGIFILVTPGQNHLFELKEKLYEKPYLNEIKEVEIKGLSLIQQYELNNTTSINNIDLINLYKMTPYYKTSSKQALEKLQSLDNLPISFSFMIRIFQKL